MSSSPDRRSSAARASRVPARARNCPGHQRQIAPQSQHPAGSVVFASVEQNQAEVEQRAPASRSVFHFTEEQRRLPQQPIGVPQLPCGRGHQALVQDRDTNPAAVAEATPERKAAIEQVAGLGQLTGHAVHVGQLAQRQPPAVQVPLAVKGADALLQQGARPSPVAPQPHRVRQVRQGVRRRLTGPDPAEQQHRLGERHAGEPARAGLPEEPRGDRGKEGWQVRRKPLEQVERL